MLTQNDLSMALDSISHEILLNKLGNHENYNYCLRSYLSARNQSLTICENVSSK